MRFRTWATRTSFTGAAVLLVLVFVAPAVTRAADDPDAGRPAAWEGTAFARAVEFQLNTDPLLVPIPDLVRLDLAEGAADWTAFGQHRGRASTVWPGKAVVEGPALLCFSGFPCPPGFPPAWPFSVTAEGSTSDPPPISTSRSFGDASTFTARSQTARAHAGRDYVETLGTMQDFSIADRSGVNRVVADRVAAPLRTHGRTLDGAVFQAAAAADAGIAQLLNEFGAHGFPLLITPSFAVGGAIPSFERALTFEVDNTLFSADSITSRTRLEFLNDNTVLQVRAEAVLSGVKLFGGLVRVNTIVSSAVSRTDGDVVSEVARTVDAEGVLVAGVPAGLDEHGVSFGADGVAAGTHDADIEVSVENVLGESGLVLRLVGTDDQIEPGNVRTGATGVLVHLQLDGNRLPAGALVFSTLALGNVGTGAFVAPPFEPLVLPGGSAAGGGFTSPGFPPFSGGGGGSPGEFVFEPGPLEFTSGPLTPGGNGGTFGLEFPGQGARRRLVGPPLLVATRTHLLYLAWTLSLVGLALGSRLYVPRLTARVRGR